MLNVSEGFNNYASSIEGANLRSERSIAMPDTVACGKCGEGLNEPSDISPEKREPCPKCGSKTRVFAVKLMDGIGVGGSASVRMRATVRKTGARVDELRTAENLRQDLWAHSRVEVDPEQPLHGTHRDKDGRAYFEFATKVPAEVRQLIEQHHYTDKVELTETPPLPGEECTNCGNVAGPVLPSVCPNCHFRDISACPICTEEVPRKLYTRISDDMFRCPHCKNQVRLRLNSSMFLSDGSYNQPLVVVEEVTAVHEI
jgi:hypothetical protein